MAGKTIAAYILCTGIGISIGVWARPHLESRAILGNRAPASDLSLRRLQVQQQGEFLLVRDPASGKCFLSMKGGGIVSIRC